ncbi:MAG TPA: hypothetical protein VNO30_14575 [Kofleriaceae bacterium]|nr:hypothetical protein [Kofleriaceae bacterium]
MKKMFVVSLVLTAVVAMGATGCSKKNASTTPTGTGTQTEMKKEGSDMGGATYGGNKAGGAMDPCSGGGTAPK